MIKIKEVNGKKIVNALSFDIKLMIDGEVIDIPQSGVKFSIIENIEKKPGIFDSKISFGEIVLNIDEKEIPKDSIVIVPKLVGAIIQYQEKKYPFEIGIVAGYLRDEAGKKKGVTYFALLK